MTVSSTLKSLVLLGIITFTAAFAAESYADNTYTYYSDGRIKSITYSPAQDGVVYEEYLDEDLAGQGIGRLLKRKLAVAASDGTISYECVNPAPTLIMSADLDGDGAGDLVVDFGGQGFYKYMDNSTWTLIGTASPKIISVADTDENGQEDLILDYGTGLGIWKYVNNGSSFTQIGTAASELIIAADLDGNGKKDDLIIDYGTEYGLWKYVDGTTLTQIGTASPETITIADLDENGVDDLVIDYGVYGLWKYVNNGAVFSQIGTASPKKVVAADLDGNGKKDDLIIDYQEYGIWKYVNGTTLTRIGTATSEGITIVDLDENGVDDMVIDYGVYGLWKYVNNGASFDRIGTASPEMVVSADLDGNGKKDDLVIDYGVYGLWKYENGTTLARIGTASPETMTISDLDGNGVDDIVIDYGVYGVYKYLNGTTLTRISTLNADRETTIYAYQNADFTGLLYTEKYDASGNLLSKTYSDEIEKYSDDLMKRKKEAVSLDIYEYADENWQGRGWGRIITHYDSSEGTYRTYGWGSTQVTVTQYAGTYAPAAGSAVQSDVVVGEKRSVYVYDHKNEETNLTYPSNGWVMRAQTQYDTDGATVKKRYEYDAYGRLTKEEDPAANRYYTYAYHTGAYSTVKQYKYEYEYVTQAALTPYGSAQKDTAYKKFGTAAALFDGSGDYLTAADSNAFYLNSGNFTVDFWVRFNATSGSQTVFSQGTSDANYSHFTWTGSQWQFQFVGFTLNASDTLSSGTWYHVALVRSGNAFSIYRDGTLKNSGSTASPIPNYTGVFTIGDFNYGTGSLGYYLNGSLDEFRISDIARWTSGFTPTSAAYAYDSNTRFLASYDGSDAAVDFTASLNSGALRRTYEYDTAGNLIKVIYAQPGLEYYAESPYKLKREITAGSDIYERLNETYGGNDYGRITLIYDSSEGAYRTYDWGASQVTVNSYSGAYLVEENDAVRHGVVASDRNDTFIYDHKNQETNLDTLSNGWVMREHTVYAADGSTMAEKYVYDPAGRLTRDDHAADGKYYTYTYFTNDAGRIKYKEEHRISDNALLATYTYFYANGSYYTSGKLDADGSYTKYYYNDSWVFTGAEWQSADRLTVRKYDSDWNMMTEKAFTGTPFMRGVNLPWLEYGYDAGTYTLGTLAHKGFSSNDVRLFEGNAADKYRGLETWRGDFVRIFIFGDMRSGITFSGTTPTGVQALAYTDMQALCDAAELLGIKLIPVLLDFKMADGISYEGSTNVGDHPTCITNSTDRNALVSVLGDFVHYFRNESSIYAWEIMNEPEEIKYDNQATWEELQTFVKAMAAEIHTEDPGSIVTLGAQDRRTLFGVADDPNQLPRWTDAALGGTSAEHLDLYQFHYYNNMENYDPTSLDVDCPASDKPVLMGEVDPTVGSNGMTIVQKLNNIYFNGYDGALFWEDDQTTYPTMSDESYADIQNWTYGLVVDEHYQPSGLLKRKTEETGNIYEYLNENWESQGWGRTILSYDNGSGYYYTYAWENPAAGEVRVEKYQGSYGPAAGSATWSDVQSGEKKETAVYLHNGQEVNLNVSTNGWLIQEKTVYGTDRRYTYEYFDAPNQTKVHIEKEYVNSTAELYATRTYDTSGNLVSVVYEDDTIENYASGRMKRKIEGATGNIYEYKDENWNSQGFGRIMLSYSSSQGKYWTYDWGSSGATQVTVSQYSGAYAPATDSAAWSDVVAGEKRQTCIYDHNGEEVNLNTSTNGWILRQKTDYATDGTTVTGQYSYYATTGRIMRQISQSGDTTEFLDEAAGRVSLYYGSGEYKTYDWGAAQVTVTQYAGIYIVGITSAARADVQTSERRYEYVYDHNNAFNNLDTNSNGWVMRLSTTYSTDGTTQTQKTAYYADGKIKRYTPLTGASSGDITEYSSSVSGRVTLYSDISASQYKTYSWGATQVTVTEYSGSYSAAIDADPNADVQTAERRTDYVFDHKNEFTNLNTSTNGWVMRAKTVYATNGTTINERYSYYADGRMKRKILSSGTDTGDITEYIDEASNRMTLYYDASSSQYKTYDWGSTQVTETQYTGTYTANIDDNTRVDVVDNEKRYVRTYDHGNDWDGPWTLRKQEEFDTSASWTQTYWYYTSGNLSKKLVNTGEAATYFDTTQHENQTYWSTDGKISHWNSVADYDCIYTNLERRNSWYMDGTKLEVYSYYASNRVKYKDVYTNVGGIWTWSEAAVYLDSGAEKWGDWGHWASGIGETGASSTFTLPTKPTRSDVSSLNLNLYLNEAVTSEDTLIPESLQLFYEKLDALKAGSTGAGVLVGMLDSGVNADDIKADVIGGRDFTGGTSYADPTGHGTKMAEVLAATASGADILALKVMDENNETTGERVSDAIRYAVDSGAKVINMSFTLFPVSDGLKSAIDYAASKNVVLIAASGNEGTEILDKALASEDNVITVGSVDKDGKLSAWSNYGDEVDLYAPWDVISQSAESKAQSAGTSYSAAFVAGISALILAENPEFTADDVLVALKAMLPAVKTDLRTTQNAELTTIKGVSVDEVVSLQDALAKQKAEFTGTSVKAEILTKVNE